MARSRQHEQRGEAEPVSPERWPVGGFDSYSFCFNLEIAICKVVEARGGVQEDGTFRGKG